MTCRSASSPRSCDPADPAHCGYPSRLPANASQKNDATCRHEAGLLMLDRSTACFITRCKPVSAVWCRAILPLTGSRDRCAEGNTHCHDHSLPAFTYFFASCPRQRHPAETRRQILLMQFPHPVPDVFSTAHAQLSGSIVTRLPPPLPSRTMIWPRAKSMSFTRSRNNSNSRSPVPYNICAIN